MINEHQDQLRLLDVKISDTATVDSRVVFTGAKIVVQDYARLDAACVIGEGVTVGRGAWIRPGAVALRSVPPHAIVEGNPAHVVGYLNRKNSDGRPHPIMVDTHNHKNMDRPACIPLEVGESALYLMRHFVDARGSLTVGELAKELPFIPNRYFVVFDVPAGELRGEHAHKQCQQFLVCAHGSCRILLDDGQKRCEITLDSPDMGVFMPPMIWGTQYRYSPGAVLLAFASHPYEAEDYLRTYDEFLDELKRQKQ